MRHSLRRAAVLTAIAGTAVFVLGPAALAQPTSQSPEADALYATGAVSLGPTADATEPTDTTEEAVGVTISPLSTPLFTVGSTANDALYDTVTLNSASSSVDQLSSGGLDLLDITGGTTSAAAITTTCTANSDGSITMNTSVVDLDILGDDIGSVTTVSPDDTLTGLSLPTGVTATVELNKQTTDDPATGEDTVTGLYISLTDSLVTGLSETIDIATATCGPYNSSGATPLASGKGVGIGLGAVGLVGGAVATVYVRRRRGALSAI
jgi:hypothetical protein